MGGVGGELPTSPGALAVASRASSWRGKNPLPAARVMEALNIRPAGRVLEVGLGSGIAPAAARVERGYAARVHPSAAMGSSAAAAAHLGGRRGMRQPLPHEHEDESEESAPGPYDEVCCPRLHRSAPTNPAKPEPINSGVPGSGRGSIVRSKSIGPAFLKVVDLSCNLMR